MNCCLFRLFSWMLGWINPLLSGARETSGSDQAIGCESPTTATAAWFILASACASLQMMARTPTSAAVLAGSSTVLLHLDHMNDPKGYCGLLCEWSRQLSITGPLFVPFDERHRALTDTKRRPRHILAVLDCPTQEDGKEFMLSLIHI